MEQLTHPADYRLINITKELEERQFSSFAADVCGRRLEQVLDPDVIVPVPNKLLPELSPEDEAIKLGVKEATEFEDLQNEVADDEEFKNWCSNAHPLEIFALASRAREEGMSNAEKLRDVLANPNRWAVHFENYKHCYLFAIRKGKRGIRKYFTGWRVFCLLSASNIRYLLELVDQSLKRHFEGLDLDPLKAISHEIQTKVAQDTGQKYLRELERNFAQRRETDAASAEPRQGVSSHGRGSGRAYSRSQSVPPEGRCREQRGSAEGGRTRG